MTSRTSTVARVVVDQLVALGADVAFGVPGESYLAVLDALHDTPALRFVTCRQESGAAYAAEANAKLTGRPGVVMVTRGPGVMNASIGIHLAQQDETPLLVLVGQVARSMVGRDAFQEVDLAQVFGSVCKAVHRIDVPERAAETVATAWATALAGRPGPVIIGLPEDVLDEPIEAQLVRAPSSSRTGVDPATVGRVRDLLAAAQRPVAILGGSRWSDRAVELAPAVLRGVPLLTGFRRQDLVDRRLDAYGGALGIGPDPALLALVADSDLVLAIGDRLDDPTTNGFTLFPHPDPGRPLVHVHPDPRELDRQWRTTVAVVADPEAFLSALGTGDAQPAWAGWMQRAHINAQAWGATPGLLDDIARGMRALLPADAIVTNGAGNFTRPFHRSYAYGRPGRQLAPTGGTMGYGLPAAVAAKITHPERTVVCVAGDGDLMMTCQELATAVHEGAAVVVLVVDNASYGTIRTHQERRYPGRPVATALTNPDFVAFAQSFGMHAERTTDAAGTLSALQRAMATGRPALVHLVTDR